MKHSLRYYGDTLFKRSTLERHRANLINYNNGATMRTTKTTYYKTGPDGEVIMAKKLIHYTVEVRDVTTGYWHVTTTIEPHWMRDETIVSHHFLIWRWETLRRLVSNVEAGDIQCRKRAIAQAIEDKYNSPAASIRVRKTIEHIVRKRKCSYTLTVWRDGQWEDC